MVPLWRMLWNIQDRELFHLDMYFIPGKQVNTKTFSSHLLCCSCFLHVQVGQAEGMADKLRSILAQFDFKYRIELYEAKGIPFSTYLYVPEEHPETKAIFL